MTTQVSGIDPYTENGIELTLADGKITAIESCSSPASGYLSAGLFDLQVNGFAGIDLNAPDVTPEEVIKLCQILLAEGVTSFLPTLITASEASLCSAMEKIVLATKQAELARQMIVGLHIEGPAISTLDGARGAHPAAHIRPPSVQEFDHWQTAAQGLIKLVTLAPEQLGTLDYIAALTNRGVRCAIGHTAANPAQIKAAADGGATLTTHLGNAVTAELPRHPNLIWSQLDHAKLYASFIADGQHLSAEVFRVMLRAKGLDKSILVSDSVSLAGMPPGKYQQPVGGEVVVEESGRILMAGTSFLAGASFPLSVNLCRAMDMAELQLAQVLPLVTTNPASFLGTTCSLVVGAPADVIRFHLPASLVAGKLEIQDVILAGRSMQG